MSSTTVSGIFVRCLQIHGGDSVGKYIFWFDQKAYAYADTAAEAVAIMVGYYGGEDNLPEIDGSTEYKIDKTLVDQQIIERAIVRGKQIKATFG